MGYFLATMLNAHFNDELVLGLGLTGNGHFKENLLPP